MRGTLGLEPILGWRVEESKTPGIDVLLLHTVVVLLLPAHHPVVATARTVGGSIVLVVAVRLPLVRDRVVAQAVHGHVHAHVDRHGGGEVVGGRGQGARHRPGGEGRRVAAPPEAVHGVERSVVGHVGVVLTSSLTSSMTSSLSSPLSLLSPGQARLVWAGVGGVVTVDLTGGAGLG